MDQRVFDRITAIAGTASSRRAGLAAALGLVFRRGALSGDAAAKTPGAHREGPCGDGSRADNRCQKNADCCTEICTHGLENIDGDGRCRCRRRGQPCEKNLNCCSRGGQQLVCLGGVCGRPCTALGAVCTGNSACCAGTCTASPAGLERGIPSAATCCLALGETGCQQNGDCCGNVNGAVICQAGICLLEPICFLSASHAHGKTAEARHLSRRHLRGNTVRCASHPQQSKG
ncbi:MAG: hypothetical protein ACR2J8_05755 [Thermomicrobiales bacterium]